MNKQIFNEEHRELLEEKHQKTIQSIRELQEMEKYMYQNLNALSGEDSDNTGKEEQVIQRINELSQMRINLFTQLKNQYNDAATDLNDSRRSLRDQVMSVQLVEEELKQAKKNYDLLVNKKNNKVRMIEIGNYQYDRYNAHIEILKIISVTCAIVIVLSILYHGDLIPGSFVSVSIVAVVSVSIIYTLSKVVDLINRSNFVYDQYNWHTDHAELQPGYQGVLQHDKQFFDKIGQEVEGTMKKGVSDLKHASSDIGHDVTHAVGKVNITVQPTQSSSVESFSLYH